MHQTVEWDITEGIMADTRAITRRRPRIVTGTERVTEPYVAASPLADVLTQAAYVFFAVLEALLITRFILRLAGANPFNEIVAWVYNATAVFVVPFESIFPPASTSSSVLEVSTLVAMIAYLFIFYLAIALFRLFVPGEEVVNPDGEEI